MAPPLQTLPGLVRREIPAALPGLAVEIIPLPSPFLSSKHTLLCLLPDVRTSKCIAHCSHTPFTSLQRSVLSSSLSPNRKKQGPPSTTCIFNTCVLCTPRPCQQTLPAPAETHCMWISQTFPPSTPQRCPPKFYLIRTNSQLGSA